MGFTPGVYQIKCKNSGNVYIGSSFNIENRWCQHFEQMADGSHGNFKLKTAYIRYGRANFETSILEVAKLPITEDRLQDLEQQWLNSIPLENRLNILTNTKAHRDYIPYEPPRKKKKVKGKKKHWTAPPKNTEPVARRVRRKSEDGTIKEWKTTEKVMPVEIAKKKKKKKTSSINH